MCVCVCVYCVESPMRTRTVGQLSDVTGNPKFEPEAVFQLGVCVCVCLCVCVCVREREREAESGRDIECMCVEISLFVKCVYVCL